jgi:hypothetical protein
VESLPGFRIGTIVAILQDDGKVCSFQILLYKRNRFFWDSRERFFNIEYGILSGPVAVLWQFWRACFSSKEEKFMLYGKETLLWNFITFLSAIALILLKGGR